MYYFFFSVMDVQRLWIWVALRLIFFMNEKNMVSRGGEEACELLYVWLLRIVRQSTWHGWLPEKTSLLAGKTSYFLFCETPLVVQTLNFEIMYWLCVMYNNYFFGILMLYWYIIQCNPHYGVVYCNVFHYTVFMLGHSKSGI